MATKIIIGDVGTTSCVELNDESLLGLMDTKETLRKTDLL